MRPIVRSALVTALLLVPSSVADARSRDRRSTCAIYRCTTLAADAGVRVVRARPRGVAEQAFERTVARWLPSGRTTWLGDELTTTTWATVTRVAVAGHYVAYAMEAGAKESGNYWTVHRLDAYSGAKQALPANRLIEGRSAIRSLLEDWFRTYEELEYGLEEVRDLGNRVVFAVVVLNGRPTGSAGHVRQREGWVIVWVRDLIARIAVSEVDEGRAMAERLAEGRE